MKMKANILIILAAAACTACSDTAPEAALTVTLDHSSYKAGEPVTFRLGGDPDNIVFYSGERGHEYELRDREYADNALRLDFVSYTDYSKTVVPNLQVLISSDFSGIYDAENLAAATWTDVTDLFELPAAVSVNTPSGSVDLTSYVPEGNDVICYIAFRYHDIDGVGVRNRWVLRSLNLKKVSPEGAVSTFADIKTAGWQNVVVSGELSWTLPGSQMLIAGNANTSDKDVWAVSAGFKLREAEASTGVVLKNLSTELDEFSYTYTEPGVYDAVFASSSVWYNSSDYGTTTVRVVVE
ncbi:MAG: DUF5017 domain-containing protein [Muribaculaceae bacterium]|nr:DUF5017 domain-containing protein [Muribaculaceae bacterium]